MVSKGETLLSASAVKLYGRVVKGLTVNLADARVELGSNRFLRDQLDEIKNIGAGPLLARIYGFSYMGQYTSLTCAAIFLVHGEGELASSSVDSAKGGGTTSPPAAAASSTDASGVAAKDWALSTDIRVWEYDRADFSLRLDVDSGPLERILINKQTEDSELPYFRGRYTRSGNAEG